MHFFHYEMSSFFNQGLLMNYYLHIFYCVPKFFAQRYVGSVVNWTDFELVASTTYHTLNITVLKWQCDLPVIYFAD